MTGVCQSCGYTEPFTGIGNNLVPDCLYYSKLKNSILKNTEFKQENVFGKKKMKEEDVQLRYEKLIELFITALMTDESKVIFTVPTNISNLFRAANGIELSSYC